MLYVLIVFSVINGDHSLSMLEFKSQAACESFKTVLQGEMAQFDRSLDRRAKKLKCIPKGE